MYLFWIILELYPNQRLYLNPAETRAEASNISFDYPKLDPNQKYKPENEAEINVNNHNCDITLNFFEGNIYPTGSDVAS